MEVAAQWYAQAALIVEERDAIEDLQHRVDEHGERERWFVRIALVSLYTQDADSHRRTDLLSSDPGALGIAHRLDHVVDQALHFVAA